ncbi:6-phosphogluconolactonase [candidate division KSB1 bacterium]|nr:6-phosphogluconolactonase [candidate division KSB1 bacterium]
MNIKERNFPTIESAAHALADDLADIIRKAISVRGRAFLAVSGGRTPKYVFERLCKSAVDWSRVIITLTDERWVMGHQPESNENLVRSYLLQGPAATATFIPFFGGEKSPEAGEAACEARLKKLDLPFDAVYLGVGEDGHFASLFPGDPAVDARDSLCVPVPETESRLSRMSLTVPTILNARKIFLLFSGSAKHAMYANAKNSGSYKDIPIRLILSQSQTPVFVLTAP